MTDPKAEMKPVEDAYVVSALEMMRDTPGAFSTYAISGIARHILEIWNTRTTTTGFNAGLEAAKALSLEIPTTLLSKMIDTFNYYNHSKQSLIGMQKAAEHLAVHLRNQALSPQPPAQAQRERDCNLIEWTLEHGVFLAGAGKSIAEIYAAFDASQS